MGLRRAALLTEALVTFGVAGTVGVAIAPYAADSPDSTPVSGSSTPSDLPSLSGTDGAGQATSGGS